MATQRSKIEDAQAGDELIVGGRRLPIVDAAVQLCFGDIVIHWFWLGDGSIWSAGAIRREGGIILIGRVL